MSTLYQFHVNLFAAPPRASFATTWEQVAAAIEQLPRVIFELDGSFVYSGTIEPSEFLSPNLDRRESRRWQVDGHLFDFDERLHRVELRGRCPQDAFDALLRCVGWPSLPVAFESVIEGDTLDEQQFRQRASIAARASQ